MTEDTVQPLGQRVLNDGSVVAETKLSPAGNSTRGSMVVPPTTVVPVIFVPGIMGSNLRDAESKESIWNTNSTISILLQWIFRSASTRQRKLRAQHAEVNPTGNWYGASATVVDKDTGLKRGQGTTSRAFYGDFVRWLDDNLNASSTTEPTPPSPWKSQEDQDFSQTWHAEKPFQVLTKDASEHIWDNFFCPVHVVGYNWLQSNGDSGKYLAEKIVAIIQAWDGKQNAGGPSFKCEQVILVSHSMGGLVTRAAVHSQFGNVADKVLGIVHGEQPANGAAAAYHHCRSGYGGVSGWVLGRNAAQVTAVFANSPGAMELLPNHQYPAGWLKVKENSTSQAAIQLPASEPYEEIYLKKERWWRLVDERLIDPSRKIDNPWLNYKTNLATAKKFHMCLAASYHSQTYVHYGADNKKYPTYSDLVWQSTSPGTTSQAELYEAKPTHGSDPVTVLLPVDNQTWRFSIVDPEDVGYPQPGDGTVPACSGEAPNKQGGGNVRQSFRLSGFEHQASYDNHAARQSTLYAIGMLLQQAKVL